MTKSSVLYFTVVFDSMSFTMLHGICRYFFYKIRSYVFCSDFHTFLLQIIVGHVVIHFRAGWFGSRPRTLF